MLNTQYILLITLLFSFKSFSAISNLNITGVSLYESSSTSSSNPVIYGGLAGSFTCSDTSELCNNCDTHEALCNEKRIGDSVRVSFSFVPDASGHLVITNKDNDQALILASGSSTTAIKGVTTTVITTWGEICDALTESNTGCPDTAGDYLSGSILVGVSTDSTEKFAGSDTPTSVNVRTYAPVTTQANCDTNDTKGLCDIKVEAGDRKAYITYSPTQNTVDGVTPTTDFTVTSTISIKKLRVMFSTDSYDATNPGADYEDLSIGVDGISQDVIRGLENNTNYAFSFANIDTAGNIAYFLDSTTIVAGQTIFYNACGFNTTDSLSTASDAQIYNCPYTTKPEEIIGLLEESFNCFIATAAYGTSFNLQLDTFRAFRNEVLLKNHYGQLFVKYYYKYGSRASMWIKDSEYLRTLVRFLLLPLFAMAWLILKLGFLPALASFSAVTFLGFKFSKLLTKGRNQ